MDQKSQRGTIFVEQARIIEHRAWPAEQFVLRLEAPRCARAAQPGSFVHLQCHPLMPMRRPLSIMRADPDEGWIELLYKVVGRGTALLARRQPGERIDTLGPIGRPFRYSADRPRPLLVGGGVGIPPMAFLATAMRGVPGAYEPLVLMGSEVPFPFELTTATRPVAGIPGPVQTTLALLENQGLACRLASEQGYPGCYQGYVTDLARAWLDTLGPEARREVAVFACGPHPMLRATARMARELGIPCQVSLEEFMACAVGGCAGCTVEVQTPEGPAMKRVCVDGPVFEAEAVFGA